MGQEMISDPVVAVVTEQGFSAYAEDPPYGPEEVYPELRGKVRPAAGANPAYSLLRRLLLDWGMDADRAGTERWNPLGGCVRPGDTVLIKPNLVRHLHWGGGDFRCVVTHASLVRAVLDYVALALEGRGEITVGDAPIQSADFGRIVERTGLAGVCAEVSRTWGVPVRLLDFRRHAVQLDPSHAVRGRDLLVGDPAGYCRCSLGKESLLAGLGPQGDRFRVTNFDAGELQSHHRGDRHEYLIPRTVLSADVVINLPKLKTHRKVGMTAALKNMVGINSHKDWLPHHRYGSVPEGGDEYPLPSYLKRLYTRLIEAVDRESASPLNPIRRLAGRVVFRLLLFGEPHPYLEGSWYGNDTLWRTVLDLNRILVYADEEGVMQEAPQRKCLTIVDGLLAGEGEGPMEPDPLPCGLLAGGANPAAVDAVLATIIGFDFRKIPLIAGAFTARPWPLALFAPDAIEVRSGEPRWSAVQAGRACRGIPFRPPRGWAGHIELPVEGG